jgi:hypothetical protein
MPDLMQVKDLNGKLVPGYRTLNVLGVTPGRRGILYHRLFSSVAKDFDSEPLEVQRGLKTVSQAVQGLKERMAVSWIADSTMWPSGARSGIRKNMWYVAFSIPSGWWSMRPSMGNVRKEMWLPHSDICAQWPVPERRWWCGADGRDSVLSTAPDL